MKKLHAITLLVTILPALLLSSEDVEKNVAQYNSRYQHKRKGKPPPSLDSMVEKKIDGQFGIKMPTQESYSNKRNFSFQTTFLYMRAKNESLVYANQNTLNLAFGAPSAINQINQGKIIRPSRNWKPGFKLAARWNTSFDQWGVTSSWTYYYNKNITSHSVPNIALSNTLTNSNEGLFPYWSASSSAPGSASILSTIKFQNLHGVWQLNYNTLKLHLGRSLYLTKALSLRPYFGIQNSWIHQKMRVRYSKSFQNTAGNPSSLNQAIDSNNRANFWGIGMCAGLDSYWNLGMGFSILGKVTGALLSGRTNVRRIDSVITVGNEFFRVGNNRDKVDQIVPGLEANMGVNWGRSFIKEALFLDLSVSWESAFWWQQFKFLRPQFGNSTTYLNEWNEYPSASETLIIEGITITASLDF